MNIGMGWGEWVGVGQSRSCLQPTWHTHEHWDGVGWGGTITFMSSLAQSTWRTQTHEHWDGVG